LQDLLGDVHDLDVLAKRCAGHGGGFSGAGEVAGEHRTRAPGTNWKTYRQLTLGSTSLWNQWRAGLPTNGRVAEVAESAFADNVLGRRIRVLAKTPAKDASQEALQGPAARKVRAGLLRKRNWAR